MSMIAPSSYIPATTLFDIEGNMLYRRWLLAIDSLILHELVYSPFKAILFPSLSSASDNELF